LGAFYSESSRTGQFFFEALSCLKRLSLRGGSDGCSSVGERFVEAGAVIQFAAFENFTAVETFYIFRSVILGDQPRALVLAARVGHDGELGESPPKV
jgi:hypothetical protein